MNARLYDAPLGRFLSPDPYVQAPDFSQSFNRYSYAWNNPLVYTDPDGEFVHLVIGAIIGGTINWLANGAEFSWKGLGYFGVGAAAGALGAGVGVGIQTASAGASFWAGFVGSSQGITTILSVGYTSSFLTGAAVGAGAGFAGGFTTGFGNGLMQGQSFGDALWSGTKGGLIGGASGALLGGIGDGIRAYRKGRDFWTGNPWEVTHDYRLPDGNLPIVPQADPSMGCTQKTLESFERYRGSIFEVPVDGGADFMQLAIKYGYNVYDTPSNVHAVGREMLRGYPSALTYNNGGTYHTVGINRIQVMRTPRVFGNGFREKILINVMDPLLRGYPKLSFSNFSNGYIRTLGFYRGFDIIF